MGRGVEEGCRGEGGVQQSYVTTMNIKYKHISLADAH